MNKTIKTPFVLFTFLSFILLFACNDNEKDTTQITLTTIEATYISSTTVSCGGNIISVGGATIISRGLCWSTKENPTIADNKTTDGGGIGLFTSLIKGLIPTTTYYVRAYATNSESSTVYGNEYQVTTLSTITDVDGNIYNTIKIGTQTWTVENLKTTKYNDENVIPEVTDNIIWSNLSTGAYCNYNNDIVNGVKFGKLYNWYAVNTGKLAPKGWHVSTDVDWTVLENLLTSKGFNYDNTTSGNKIAKSLASNDSWLLDSKTGVIGNELLKNNKTGFNALPGGGRYTFDPFFQNIEHQGFWWSPDLDGSDRARYRCLSHDGVDLYRSIYAMYVNSGFSVRCVKD